MADNDGHSPTCAACGKNGDGLKACAACNLVKYCNVDCQKAHRPQHNRECKKRAAEIFDEKLFSMPPREECPICCLKMPISMRFTTYNECCGTVVCSGCMFAVCLASGNRDPSCPFCRAPATTWQERVERNNRRIKLNDPNAYYIRGVVYCMGIYDFPRDMAKALEYWEKAIELGSREAHLAIGVAYAPGGNGPEVNVEKSRYHYQIAAMGGSMEARFNLGNLEALEGDFERAKRHFMISASAGCERSLKKIRDMYSRTNVVAKAEFEKALRDYKDSFDETKSKQRDEAAAAIQAGEFGVGADLVL